MKKLCCDFGTKYVNGQPGAWMVDGVRFTITFCPFCGNKLPETYISNFEVVVRFDRGLGAEFKKLNVEAVNQVAAKVLAEKEASDLLAGSKFNILGCQVTPIKA